MQFGLTGDEPAGAQFPMFALPMFRPYELYPDQLKVHNYLAMEVSDLQTAHHNEHVDNRPGVKAVHKPDQAEVPRINRLNSEVLGVEEFRSAPPFAEHLQQRGSNCSEYSQRLDLFAKWNHSGLVRTGQINE